MPRKTKWTEATTRYKPYVDMLMFNELIYVSKKKYGIPPRITMEFIESNVLLYIHIISLGEEEYRHAIKLLLDYGFKPSAST